MKRKLSPFSIIIATLVILCLGLGSLNFFEIALISVDAQQDDCPTMSVGGSRNLTWPAGATVKVFFHDNIDPDRRAIYEQVLTNWSNMNGQGVRFSFDTATGTTYHALYIQDTQHPDPTERGRVMRTTYNQATGELETADYYISPHVTDPAALANVISHEIAHNFGLNHTNDASLSNKTSSSLYNGANGFNDTTTGSPIPTPCDLRVIKSIYDAGGVQFGDPPGTADGDPSGTGSGGGGGDECPCGNCEIGCNDPDPEPNCGWQTIPGSCWTVSTEWTDPYTGITYGEETIECDPDQEVYVCE